MVRKAVFALLFTGLVAMGCDRGRAESETGETNKAEEPAKEASSRPVQSPDDAPKPPAPAADQLPETVEVVPSTTEQRPGFVAAEASSRQIVGASDDNLVCVEKVFTEAGRILWRADRDCKPKAKELLRLHTTDDGRELATFGRLVEHSAPLDALQVETDGKLQFLSMSDGTVTEAPTPKGSEVFYFVQNRPEVMAFGHPQSDPDAFAFSIVEGLPKSPVEPTRIERRLPDRGTLTFDEERNLYVYRDVQTECFRAAIDPDGTKPAYCEARVLRGKLTGKRPLWTPHWLILTDPRGSDNLALNIYTKEEFYPTKEECEEPFAVRIDPDIGVPRMVFGCPVEGSTDSMSLRVWTPKKTYTIPGGPFRPAQAHGDLVALQTKEGSEQWLDVRRIEMVDPGGLRLLSADLAVRRKGESFEVVLVRDARKPQPLGSVDCADTLQATHSSDDVVTLVCGKPWTPAEADGCPSKNPGLNVTKAWAWDLANRKVFTSEVPFIGSTKDDLLAADASVVQRWRACGAKAIRALPRK